MSVGAICFTSSISKPVVGRFLSFSFFSEKKKVHPTYATKKVFVTYCHMRFMPKKKVYVTYTKKKQLMRLTLFSVIRPRFPSLSLSLCVLNVLVSNAHSKHIQVVRIL